MELARERKDKLTRDLANAPFEASPTSKQQPANNQNDTAQDDSERMPSASPRSPSPARSTAGSAVTDGSSSSATAVMGLSSSPNHDTQSNWEGDSEPFGVGSDCVPNVFEWSLYNVFGNYFKIGRIKK